MAALLFGLPGAAGMTDCVLGAPQLSLRRRLSGIVASGKRSGASGGKPRDAALAA
jgi:hypothetical protein